MTTPPRFTILRPTSVDELVTLEPLVAEIFGPRDRPPGWFTRKLRREVVDPALSRVARSERGEMLGLVLVGAPASEPGTAQIVTLGVLGRFQGNGCGRALLRAATSAATSRGLQRLTALVEARRLRFYEAAGFKAILSQNQKTLVATTPGSPQAVKTPLRALPPAPWDRPQTLAVNGWLEEAWIRTPQAQRQTIAIGGERPQAWAHISIEGQARLCHRLLIDDRLPPDTHLKLALAACNALRGAFASSGPLFLYGLPAVRPITDALLRTGWQNAQESTLMVHSLVEHTSPDLSASRRQGATARVIMAPDRR